MAEKTKDQSAAAMTIENLPSSPERGARLKKGGPDEEM